MRISFCWSEDERFVSQASQQFKLYLLDSLMFFHYKLYDSL